MKVFYQRIEACSWAEWGDECPGVVMGQRRNAPRFYVKTREHGNVDLVRGSRYWVWKDPLNPGYFLVLEEAEFRKAYVGADAPTKFEDRRPELGGHHASEAAPASGA
jgi:hypothetical protein